MNLDVARSQQKQVAAAFQMLAAFALGVLMILALNAASDRARAQDFQLQRATWVDGYIEATAEPIDWRNPPTLRLAALTVRADREEGAIVIPHSMSDVRTFDSSHFDRAAHATNSLDCLSQAIYYEARSESRAGQIAVAQVVMNRVRHSAWPDTICGVVFEGSERTTGCQFSFTCDGSMDRAPRGRSWERSQQVAQHVMLGFNRDNTRRATHYHTVAVDPYWNDNLILTRQIGSHIFYRFANRRERLARARADREA